MRTLALSCFVALAGCSGLTSDPGLESMLRIAGAQYFQGQMPTGTKGPAISSFSAGSSIVRPGELSAGLTGIITRNTTAIAIQLQGDPGFWVVEPGAEDPTQLDQLAFSARASLSPSLPEGSFTVVARAATDSGAYGPPSTISLMTAASAQTDTLLVSLRWDTEADLDLHLIIPDGTEIWANKINSYNAPPPGTPSDPTAYQSGGILDYDSNANCVIDGRRLENIYWTQTPPSGHYIVRVDTFSLCQAIQADWQVDVTLDGKSLGRAMGVGNDAAASLPHGAGQGLTAIQFDVP